MSAENENLSRAYEERERLRAELQSRSVLLFITLASIGDAVITTDSDGDVSFLNPMAETLTGWSLAEAVGLPIERVFRLVDESTGDVVENPVRQALAIVAKVELQAGTLLVRKDEKSIPIDDSAAPIMGAASEVLGTVLVFRDITDRKKNEQVIKYRSELDRMVARISTGFIKSSVVDVDIRIDEALGEFGQFFGADRAYVFLYSEAESTMTATHEWHAEGIEPLVDTVIDISSIPLWAGKIIDRHHIRVSDPNNMPEEAVLERAIVAKRGVKSLLAVPMSQVDVVLGFIGIESITEPRVWPEETVNMLYLTGNVFASAMGRRDAQRKLDAARQREVEIGFRIQQTLLLSPPPIASADFEVAAVTTPSRGIDGDFYDFVLHPDRSLDVIFGDVMGKGVPAALLSAGTKTEFLRSLSHLLVSSAQGDVPQPADIVNSVHGILTPQLLNLDSFVTLSYVRFNPQRKKVTIVDCGNTRMLRCTWSDGVVHSLSGFNMPLGFSPSEVYQEAEYDYESGDIFLLYSDGVTEARNSDCEMFSTERLERLVADKYRLSPLLLVESIQEAVTGFVGSSVLADDLTCVAIRIPPLYVDQPPPASREIQVSSSLGELAAIRAFLRGFCAQHSSCDVNMREFTLLELAVNEVASNIMRHAYHGRTDQRIWIRMSQEKDSMRVRLTHKGELFQSPEQTPALSLDEQKEGGFGLYIIHNAVDGINYGQDSDGRPYIELTKRLSSISGG